MANTVVGIFDDAREAQNAVEKLVASGISRDNIDITSGSSGSGASHISSERSDSDSDSNIIGNRRVTDDDGETRTVDAKGKRQDDGGWLMDDGRGKAARLQRVLVA